MAKLIGETDEPFSASNVHPGFGKDDNIANELGHTHYPKYLHKFEDDGKIKEDIEFGLDDKGKKIIINRTAHSRIVNNQDEEDAAEADGFLAVWVKPKIIKDKVKVKDPFGK